jgi:hypothetical protein
MEEGPLNVPGFTAEASLGPASGSYNGLAVHDGSRGTRVVPMQGFRGFGRLGGIFPTIQCCMGSFCVTRT